LPHCEEGFAAYRNAVNCVQIASLPRVMCVRARRSQCSSSESARSRWLDLYKQQNHTSGGIGDIVPFGVVIIFCFSSPARKTNSDSDEREHTTVLQ